MHNPNHPRPQVYGAPDRIPVTAIFDGPPFVDGTLIVGAEHGDIVIHVEFEGKLFCAMVVTMDSALTLSLWLCAHVVDERRRTSRGKAI